jgi:hypothetical protein
MLMNIGIEEDKAYPKEPAHLDYKYNKSYEGPMTQPTALTKSFAE